MLISVLSLSYSFQGCPQQIDFTIIYNAKSGNINATITPEKNNVSSKFKRVAKDNKERR